MQQSESYHVNDEGTKEHLTRAGNMVAIRNENQPSQSTVGFLQHCYRFVNDDWQHAQRSDLPDQGFENAFRSSSVQRLAGWEISQEREMRFGQELDTASGVMHEIDLVAKHAEVNAVAELKNRQSVPTKNDVIVFFAKILDFLAANPQLLLKDVSPIFMSTLGFDNNGLAACLGLGIHPIAPGLRPVPLLVDNAMRVDSSLRQGMSTSSDVRDRFDDFCAVLNGLSLNLANAWISSRLGYHSDITVVMQKSSVTDVSTLGRLLRQLNSECDELLSDMRGMSR